MFETQRLGIAVFERLPETHGYQVLRDQLNVALRSIQIHQELLERTRLHERDELERMATSRRLESLSVLAGGVAHDLNNSLGPLVALPELILAELDKLDPGARSKEMRIDLESIKASSLRASQTIKDLLTLGRQGQVSKEPLDLVAVVSRCIAENSAWIASDASRRVGIVAQLPSKPLTVKASEAHLVRAISNLMHNGVEAIAGDGQLTMTAGQRHLAEAVVGFEHIEPGDYAVLSVSDTGRGIAQEDWGALGTLLQHQATGRIERHRSWPRHRAWRGQGTWRFCRCHQRARPGHDLHAVSPLPSITGTGRCSAYPDAGAAGSAQHPAGGRFSDSLADRAAGASNTWATRSKPWKAGRRPTSGLRKLLPRARVPAISSSWT